MLCEDLIHPTRRAILGSAGALFAWSYAPKYAFAAGGRDPRFVVIVLRGALDGMSALAPLGDPDYAALRETIALSSSGEVPAIAIDSFFALHPSMPNLGRLYAKREATFVHATATGYRERSHFDGQDVLESGQPAVGMVRSGWLNRALEKMPKGERIAPAPILGIGPIVPLIARGSAPVTGWAPQTLARATDEIVAQAMDLYAARDAKLADALGRAFDTARLAERSGQGEMKARGGPADAEGMKTIATGAARLIAAADGPRIAALAFEGWDTHAAQGAAKGLLAARLGGLDGAIAAFETELGETWKQTVIAVVTEFGRTAAVNGTAGSDHGTATLAMLVGGAVKGGRIVADWPGLKKQQLYEGRDLKPTTDLRAVLKGVLEDHLGLSASVLSSHVFPETGDLAPVRDLVG